MKKILLIALLFSNLTAMAEDVYVNGYNRSNGTYIQPYHRTAPDSNPYNNYSTQGNTNPYTGQQGTVNPYQNQYQQQNYQQPVRQPNQIYQQNPSWNK
ncbi:MAG: hypothetical protein ACXU8A_00115 [Burkholderiaceae bacterium]